MITRAVSQTGARLQVLLITFFTLMGLGISAGASMLTYGWNMSGWAVLGLFLISLLATFLASVDDPLLALSGYFVLSLSFGALFGPVLALYTAVSVINVFLGTIVLVTALGSIGVIYPKSLAHWGSFLFTGLLVLIVAMFGNILLRALGFDSTIVLHALDIVGIGLFSAFVIYDMNQAMNDEYTFANAVKYSVSMYLNIMNIFIRLLSLTGTRSDD